MSKMTYSEKLKHPEWQKKRLKIMERDEFKCQQCFSTKKTLHVHHRFYLSGRMPWEYLDSVLVTLCEECHSSGDHDKSNFGDDDSDPIEKFGDIDPDTLIALYDIYESLGPFRCASMDRPVILNAVARLIDAFDSEIFAAYHRGAGTPKEEDEA